jgi:polyribonucleotide nucleotidyltransferase
LAFLRVVTSRLFGRRSVAPAPAGQTHPTHLKGNSPVAETRVERQLGGQTLILETGRLAKQAHGAVLVTYGQTVVLVAAVEGKPIPGRDFFPLQIEYRERTYAAGKFPGGFIKRETRPSTKETLTSRLIDRPIRPLFPVGYFNEVQVMATVLSADKENDPDVLGIIGASAALHVSNIPFLKVAAGVRMGRVNGQLVVMPTHTQMEESDLDLVVAGHKDGICMIEGFAREMPEADAAEAILAAHAHMRVIIEAIEELRTKAGKGPKTLPPQVPDNPLATEMYAKYGSEFRKKYLTEGKLERYAAIDELKKKITLDYIPEGATETKHTASQVSGALDTLRERVFREITLGGTRIDGRKHDEIRNLSCDVSLLPRTHGSALFQRGETQALCVITLGTTQDEQKVDGLQPEYSKKRPSARVFEEVLPRLQLPAVLGRRM